MDAPTRNLESCDTVFRNFRVATMKQGETPYGAEGAVDIGVRNGVIQWMQPFSASSSDRFQTDCHIIEGRKRWLTPGLIDCHTHLIWAGNRADEWEARIQGVPYAEIAKRGGGILSTVRATRAADAETLYLVAGRRVENLIAQGVTTLEIKSGYGLDVETELKMLEVATRLKENYPIEIQRTFLGAHTVPAEHRESADQYVDLVAGPMLETIRPYCDAVDVFCETIGFTLEQSRRVLEAALGFGLPIKIHAEQLSLQGGAKLVSELGLKSSPKLALSADHIEYLDEAGCEAMRAAEMVAVLLPGAFYFIHEQQKPPIDALRKHGVPIALASDTNPGSSPVTNLLLMANFACTLFQLTPEEALAGLTRSAADALGLGNRCGTIEVGKQADFAVWNIEAPVELAYYIGHSPCEQTYKAGKLIYDQKG